jgi:Protein of unknown function (DUF2934)
MTGRRQKIQERAYGLWEAEGRQHGNDLSHWFRAEAEIPVRVTFDSNLWEHIVRPGKHPSPPERREQLVRVNRAIADGRIAAFVSDSVATMEGVRRIDRPEFLSNQPMRARVVEDHDTQAIIFAPDESSRPELKPILKALLIEAIQLGIRLIEVPHYYEFELPKELGLSASCYADPPPDFIERFHEVSNAIVQRGVGRAYLGALGHELARREGGKSYTFAVGRLPSVGEFTESEKLRITRAVAEASDGDVVSGHVAFSNDILCTADEGERAPEPSIFGEAHRLWLRQVYEINFASLSVLAEIIA